MSSENKFGRLGGTRLVEQKPFRGFDITSLIRKDEEQSRASNVNRPESKSANVGQRSRRLHQSSPALAQVGKIDQVSLFQEKTGRARRWWGDQGRLARRRTSAWVLHSPPRPTRTPTCSTRASTNSTLDSCWPMEGDRRHLLIPCCFR